MSDDKHHVVRSAHTAQQKADDFAGLVNELADDAKRLILLRVAQSMAKKLKYGGPIEYPTMHVTGELVIDGRDCMIVFTASVIPTSHIDTYGDTFGADIKKSMEQP